MSVPTLKLPDEADVDILSLGAAMEPFGFVSAFWESYEQSTSNHLPKYSYKENDRKSDIANNICQSINGYYDQIRREIDQDMQEYLLTHDGVIEAWPLSRASDTFYDDTLDLNFRFDYFGTDYDFDWAKGSYVAKNKKPGRIYRNTYRFPGTEEYNQQCEKENALIQSIRKLQSQLGIFGFLWVVVLVYCTGILLAQAADLVFHYSLPIYEWVHSLEDSNMEFTVSNIVQLLGTMLFLFPVSICGPFHQEAETLGIFYWLLAGVMMAPFLAVGLWAAYHISKRHEKKRELSKFRKELKKLRTSAEYQRISAENEKIRQEQEAFAEEWHQAWFQWIQKQKL